MIITIRKVDTFALIFHDFLGVKSITHNTHVLSNCYCFVDKILSLIRFMC